MKVVVGGGSGFIGGSVVRALLRQHEVVVLSRNPEKVRTGQGVAWHPPADGEWESHVASADVVINLAGENIGRGRWTAERKRALVESRLNATGALVRALQRSQGRPLLVQASAVGYYGSRGDEELTEEAAPGTGFLAELTARWEREARAAENVARVAILRFGIVLGSDGGALEKMLLPFRLFAGGRMGSGRQWMSWIDRTDVVRLILWTMENDTAAGVYNAVAPAPVTNREFTRTLGKVLQRPTFVTAPAFALRAALGEMAGEMLLSGQRVLPRRALQQGFVFAYPDLKASLTHAVAAGER